MSTSPTTDPAATSPMDLDGEIVAPSPVRKVLASGQEGDKNKEISSTSTPQTDVLPTTTSEVTKSPTVKAESEDISMTDVQSDAGESLAAPEQEEESQAPQEQSKEELMESQEEADASRMGNSEVKSEMVTESASIADESRRPRTTMVNGVEVPVITEPANTAEDDSENGGIHLGGLGGGNSLFPDLGARRDRSLKEFLGMMDDYAPIIPDAVTDYYLMKSGFSSSDVRIKRLLALATQKFISDIATDAYQYSRIHSSWSSAASSANPIASAGQFRPGTQTRFGGSGAAGGGLGGSGGAGGGGSGGGKSILTMEDLASALAEYGVNIHRPEFYR
ncbi:transcription initiation factor TFIID 23-30kDa subunit-domain-containing protein [Lipomyces oligophaga]|uniref:transcription initiation factor TFIID 23-30kDa subunit-domain-containing protein n=1 Tax=Lipomyces oligophaga TaxID=45792 RepID=UPI0034CDC4B3